MDRGRPPGKPERPSAFLGLEFDDTTTLTDTRSPMKNLTSPMLERYRDGALPLPMGSGFVLGRRLSL